MQPSPPGFTPVLLKFSTNDDCKNGFQDFEPFPSVLPSPGAPHHQPLLLPKAGDHFHTPPSPS